MFCPLGLGRKSANPSVWREKVPTEGPNNNKTKTNISFLYVWLGSGGSGPPDRASVACLFRPVSYDTIHRYMRYGSTAAFVTPNIWKPMFRASFLGPRPTQSVQNCPQNCPTLIPKLLKSAPTLAQNWGCATKGAVDPIYGMKVKTIRLFHTGFW